LIEATTPSASRRQQLTRTRRLSPSVQRFSFLSQRRAVEATRKFATSAFVRSTRRYSGVLSAFPTTVTFVSYIFVPSSSIGI
jgi:hypothetical protein